MSPSQFQSQTRSQSPCDANNTDAIKKLIEVSIADAKPVPVRRPRTNRRCCQARSFNRRREASPRATALAEFLIQIVGRFNRRREASPRATCCSGISKGGTFQFQSQTRSQSPCDGYSSLRGISSNGFQSQTRSQSPCDLDDPGGFSHGYMVSIADAKPVPVRRVALKSQ